MKGGVKMGIKSSADIFFIISVAAVFMSTIGWLTTVDMWLNSHTWMTVAATSGIWAVYLRMRDIHELEKLNGGNGKKK